MAFEYAVALTGGIATGKSKVALCLKKAGFVLIDADTIAHEILDQEYKAVADLFGKEVVLDKHVDRKALGNIVFSDRKKRHSLEGLLHPPIFEEIKRLSLLNDLEKKLYFVDIPLFFETKRYPINRVLVVYTPLKKQLERLMLRNELTEEEALKRIHSQLSIEEKREMASYVIDNSGTIEELNKKCQESLKEMMGVFG